MKYTFQHYYDISTSASSLNMISISCGGVNTMNRCKHLFGAYKYFKLGRIRVKLVPASTLPVDPLGLSYDVSDPNTVSPEDQLNPGLVRITNGENLYTDFTNVTQEQQDGMYLSTMLDPRWSKFALQTGFSRWAIPMYWNLGSFEQSEYPQAHMNLPSIDNPGDTVVGTTYESNMSIVNGNPVSTLNRDDSSPMGIFQTGHRGKLGWLPTDAYERLATIDGKEGSAENKKFAMTHSIPSINVITVLMPRARKTVYYYRLFVSEEIYFKGIKNVGIDTNVGGSVMEYRAIDNFTTCDIPLPQSPNEGFVNSAHRPFQHNDGSDYK